MFFLVKGLLDRLVYLSAGLAVILAFIGVKLILHWAHVDIDDRIPEVPTPLSLGVIITILVIVVVASLLKTRNDPTAKGSTAAPQPIDLAAIIDQRVSTWSAALKETGVELVVDLDRPCWITATPGAMEQVLDTCSATRWRRLRRPARSALKPVKQGNW
ncbi:MULTISPECIES: hypothetical protein [unclassified Kribbella]|uniref:hypothetical protein n=1 Tax=unclassified Kribbella TaxID=2644121 RepID=UPI00301B128E